MKATLATVFSQARSTLGDDSVAGGQVFTDAILQPHFNRAYRLAYRAKGLFGDPEIERDCYFVVPANTGVVDPATAGITDFATPKFVEERGGLTVKNITAATVNASDVTLTVTSHGFSAGDMITVNGISGISGTEGMWGISVVDANAFKILGCVASGTYVSGGVAVKSSEDFAGMTAVGRVQPEDIGAGGRYGIYAWRGGVLQFPTLPDQRQLRIVYSASGNPPSSTSATIGMDDVVDFLATYTASKAVASRGSANRARELLIEAIGPNLDERRPGGLLGQIVDEAVRAYQRIPAEQRRRLPFRDPRNFLQVL